MKTKDFKVGSLVRFISRKTRSKKETSWVRRFGLDRTLMLVITPPIRIYPRKPRRVRIYHPEVGFRLLSVASLTEVSSPIEVGSLLTYNAPDDKDPEDRKKAILISDLATDPLAFSSLTDESRVKVYMNGQIKRIKAFRFDELQDVLRWNDESR